MRPPGRAPRLNKWAVVEEFASASRTLCDYDGELPGDLCQRVFRLAGILGAHPLWMRFDRTARGFHLVVEWDREFEPSHLVAMQAILGSDSNREALNLSRVLSGIETEGQKRLWNILYRSKLE